MKYEVDLMEEQVIRERCESLSGARRMSKTLSFSAQLVYFTGIWHTAVRK